MADDDDADEYGESEYEQIEPESEETGPGQDPEEETTVESDEYWVEDDMLAEVDELVNAGLIGDEDEGDGTEGELIS